MKTFLRIASAVLIIHPAFACAADKPDDYSIHFTVQTTQGASLQRLALPKEALAAVQSASVADVRIFNGDGHAVPLAKIPLRNATIAAQPKNWPIYPVMASTNQQQNLGNLSLRIEKTAGRSIVRVIDGTNPHLIASATQQIATLVDTRPLKTPLAILTVDAVMPPGEPVLLTVTASTDLKTWRTLAQDVPVFHFGPAANAPGSMNVPLNGMRVDKEYLRISWPPGAAFNLRGVRITPAASSVAPQRHGVPLVAQRDGMAYVVSIPFATPLQAIDIRPVESDQLVPIQLSGRGSHGDKWRALTTGVVYRINTAGTESRSPPIELNGVSLRELRIEPTANSIGFSSAPRVSALLDPSEWVFVASGPPPFILAVGRASAPSTQLPLLSLIPGYTADAELKLPVAIVDVASATTRPPSKLTQLSQALGAPSARSLVLWAVLIGGVLVLAGVAWMVMRQMKTPHKPPP
ncbi:MAG: DUF3999 domain-containing protein [Thiobacillus sp.]